MRLAEFIQKNHEPILKEWESFARTLLPAAGGMSKAGLRDHAAEILTAIVADMESLQSGAEQLAKSKGLGMTAPAVTGSADDSSTKGTSTGLDVAENRVAGHLGALGQIHAALRIDDGFTLSQVVGEYRALRASVFRLARATALDGDGALRFNEAIDEALAEAVDRYAHKTNEYRDQLLGIVSHDLRNPLGAILMGATVLSRAEGLDDASARIASRIQSSARRMNRIVGDLLDLTRTRLGSAIHIVRRPTDLGLLCQLVISELEGSHPTAVVHYTSEGDLRGDWDSDRLAQVLSNLVGNALQHGDTDKPITVVATGEAETVVAAVHNEGAIQTAALDGIFEPMVRHVQDPSRASTGLGLGLYIAKELVIAHGGTIDVTSTDAAGTTFTVRLPREMKKP